MKKISALFLALALLIPAINSHAAGFFGGGPSSSGGGGATLTLPAPLGTADDDGATGASLPSTGTSGSGTTITAPVITTYENHDYILNIYGTPSAQTLPGGVTSIVPPSAPGYVITASYQVQSTAGTLAARNGSQSSSNIWAGMSLALVPTTGQTPSFTVVPSNTSPNGYLGGGGSGGSETFTFGARPANGTLMLFCYTFWTSSTPTLSGTLISAFPLSLPNSQTTINTQETLVCASRFASNEPASYSLTSSVEGVAFLIVANNVAAFDMPVNSATGNFSSSIAGDGICLQAGLNGTNQTCGLIRQVASTTSLYTSFIPSASLSAEIYAYGPDQTSSWNFGSFTGGGIAAQAGIYFLNSDINNVGQSGVVLPKYVSFVLYGQGPGDTGCAASNFTKSGTIVIDGSTGSSVPFVKLGDANYEAIPNYFVSAQIANIAFQAGVGCVQDGGGNEGIRLTNVSNLSIDHVWVSNFAGNGGHMLAEESTGNNPYPYSEFSTIDHSIFQSNGGLGFVLECLNDGGSNPPSMQNVSITNSNFVSNGANNLYFYNCSNHGGLSNAPLWTLNLNNDVFQAAYLNNSSGCSSGSPCYQIYNNNTEIQGGTATSLYFEKATSGTVLPMNQTFGNAGLRWLSATYQNIGAGFLPLFNASTNPIDSCSVNMTNAPTCVSDGAGTAGTNYVGGGSALALVTCDGVHWREAGTPAWCY